MFAAETSYQNEWEMEMVTGMGKIKSIGKSIKNFIQRAIAYFTLQLLILVLLAFGFTVALFVVSSYQRHVDKKQLNTALVTDNKKLVLSQYHSCLRGNILRKRLDKGFGTIKSFIIEAADHSKARAALETGAKKRADVAGAKVYDRIGNALQTVPITKCKQVIEDTDKIIKQVKD